MKENLLSLRLLTAVTDMVRKLPAKIELNPENPSLAALNRAILDEPHRFVLVF